MTLVKHYDKSALSCNTQEDLNWLAKKIFENGKIESIDHMTYSTNNPEQGSKNNEMVTIYDGTVCYSVISEIAPVRFAIHMTGTTVDEIVEIIDY